MPSHPAGKTYRIASIPGDGIGPEVIDAGIIVLRKLAATVATFSLHFDAFDWNSAYFKRNGRYIPPDGLEEMKKYDAIFFGSVGDPGIILLLRCRCNDMDGCGRSGANRQDRRIQTLTQLD